MERGNYGKQREWGCNGDCGRRVQRCNLKQDGEAVPAVEQLCAEGVPGEITTCDTKQKNIVKTYNKKGPTYACLREAGEAPSASSYY